MFEAVKGVIITLKDFILHSYKIHDAFFYRDEKQNFDNFGTLGLQNPAFKCNMKQVSYMGGSKEL